MIDSKRDIIVGFFVLTGIGLFGWMIFKFEELPMFFDRQDTISIICYFPEAPGITANSEVEFCGYSAGKVVSVSPPAYLPIPGGVDNKAYLIKIEMAIYSENDIRKNIVPRIYQKGLGLSYIKLVANRNEKPSDIPLVDGSVLIGEISDSSEFISETTQQKMDSMIVSMTSMIESVTSLSGSLHSQLERVTPGQVDLGQGGVQANVTTALMRLDKTLKNINVFIADKENQQNFKKILNSHARIASQGEKAVGQFQEVMVKAGSVLTEYSDLATKTSNTVMSVQEDVEIGAKAVEDMANSTRDIADSVLDSLKQINDITAMISNGDGSLAKLLKDPRLFEELTGAGENLSSALKELELLMSNWNDNGVDINY